MTSAVRVVVEYVHLLVFCYLGFVRADMDYKPRIGTQVVIP